MTSQSTDFFGSDEHFSDGLQFAYGLVEFEGRGEGGIGGEDGDGFRLRPEQGTLRAYYKTWNIASSNKNGDNLIYQHLPAKKCKREELGLDQNL